MKLTYIFHSGFAVETQSCVLVFDYWMDPADCMPVILSEGKPVYVLVSHFHEDHSCREIFSWGQCYTHTSFTYILSKDIFNHNRCQKDEADVLMVKGKSWCDKNITIVAAGSNDSGVSWIVEVAGKRIFHAGDLNNWYARFLTSDYQGGTIWSFEFGEIDPQKDEKQYLGELKDKHNRCQKDEADVLMVKGKSWCDKNIKIVAAGSNDSGVSWIVEVAGKRIFHAGDLNNWYAKFLTSDYNGGTIRSFEFGEIDPQKDEKQYLGELKDIKKMTDSFDVVLFPVDGRIGNGYTRGARQFIEQFQTGLFVPMHFVIGNGYTRGARQFIEQFQTGLFVPMHFVASGFKSAWRMKEFTDAVQIPFWKIAHEGESIDI